MHDFNKSLTRRYVFLQSLLIKGSINVQKAAPRNPRISTQSWPDVTTPWHFRALYVDCMKWGGFCQSGWRHKTSPLAAKPGARLPWAQVPAGSTPAGEYFLQSRVPGTAWAARGAGMLLVRAPAAPGRSKAFKAHGSQSSSQEVLFWVVIFTSAMTAF